MLDRVWRALIDCVDGQSKVCVHRDFHSRNLLWGADRVTRVVDFQDALYGPAAVRPRIAAARLLRTFRRDRDRAMARALSGARRWTRDYRSRRTPREFARQLDLTAMQRQLKAIGIFSRLELRDARPSHLVDIEPVLDHLIDVARDVPRLRAISATGSTDTIRPAAHESHWPHAVIECAE